MARSLYCGKVQKMKMVKVVLSCIMLSAFLFGCGKTSSLEGKLTEARGNPIAGMKIVAKQVKGTNQREATTGSDGVFKFEKLTADTEYELTPYFDSKTRLRSTKVVTGPAKQSKKLAEQILIFYLPTKEGSLVRDTVSRLLWLRDANRLEKMNWNSAIESARNYSSNGYSDWRLPKMNELKMLAAYGKPNPADKLNKEAFTNVQAGCYWTSDINEKNTAFAWAINMSDGKPVNDNVNDFKHSVWLVRDDK